MGKIDNICKRKYIQPFPILMQALREIGYSNDKNTRKDRTWLCRNRSYLYFCSMSFFFESRLILWQLWAKYGPICKILFGTGILVAVTLSPIQRFGYKRFHFAYIVDVFFENDLTIHLLYHFFVLRIQAHVSPS